VAFENPRSEQAKQQAQKKAAKMKKAVHEEEPATRSMYDTPDRLTGKAGVKELR
jgi:hypothetical protein